MAVGEESVEEEIDGLVEEEEEENKVDVRRENDLRDVSAAEATGANRVDKILFRRSCLEYAYRLGFECENSSVLLRIHEASGALVWDCFQDDIGRFGVAFVMVARTERYGTVFPRFVFVPY